MYETFPVDQLKLWAPSKIKTSSNRHRTNLLKNYGMKQCMVNAGTRVWPCFLVVSPRSPFQCYASKCDLVECGSELCPCPHQLPLVSKPSGTVELMLVDLIILFFFEAPTVSIIVTPRHPTVGYQGAATEESPWSSAQQQGCRQSCHVHRGT
jgi:hypothetical protein